MRITNTMLTNNMLRNISNNLGRMEQYQEQLATGKKIQVPSDDPVVAARALKLRTDVSEIEQYKKNVGDAQSWMEVTEGALVGMGDIFQRAKELAVQASNGTYSIEETKNIASEITQLKNQLVNIANTSYAGRYIFSGYKTDSKLINQDGTFNVGVNKNENIAYEIGIGDNININITGGDLFNNGTSASSGTKGKMMQHFALLFQAFLVYALYRSEH